MSEAQSIQWFPGHMTRTKRQIEKSLKLVDAVAEIDARAPVSSRNPVLDRADPDRSRAIILMNKCDLADPAQTRALDFAHYQAPGIPATGHSTAGPEERIGQDASRLVREVLKSDRIAAWEAKGMAGRPDPDRGCAGIPNVGKSARSSTGCALAEGPARRTCEDRPGVTRSNQLVYRLARGFELLGHPRRALAEIRGSEEVGERLAFTGAVKDRGGRHRAFGFAAVGGPAGPLCGCGQAAV